MLFTIEMVHLLVFGTSRDTVGSLSNWTNQSLKKTLRVETYNY